MKNLKLILVALVFLFAVDSCKKQPEACLSADKTSVKVGEVLTLTSCSKDANGYGWSSAGLTATTVSGGTPCDNFWKVSFSAAGATTITINADNIESGKSCSDASYNIVKTAKSTVNITVTN